MFHYKSNWNHLVFLNPVTNGFLNGHRDQKQSKLKKHKMINQFSKVLMMHFSNFFKFLIVKIQLLGPRKFSLLAKMANKRAEQISKKRYALRAHYTVCVVKL